MAVCAVSSKYFKTYVGSSCDSLDSVYKQNLSHFHLKDNLLEVNISQTGTIHRNMIGLSYPSINYRHHSNLIIIVCGLTCLCLTLHVGQLHNLECNGSGLENHKI